MTSALAVAIIVKVAVDLWFEGGRFVHSLRGRLGGGREAAERWDLWLWADSDLVAAKELRRRLTGDLERWIVTERSSLILPHRRRSRSRSGLPIRETRGRAGTSPPRYDSPLLPRRVGSAA